MFMRKYYGTNTHREVLTLTKKPEHDRQEVRSLLRDISMYRCLKKEQVLRLYPGKEERTKRIIAHLIRSRRVWEVGDYYCASPEDAEEPDQALISAFWVLLDFIDRVEYHSTSRYPTKIIFYADATVYEIIYAGSGREALISFLVTTRREDMSQYLVLVDSPDQIEELQTEAAIGYCSVTADGHVNYYKKRSDAGE